MKIVEILYSFFNSISEYFQRKLMGQNIKAIAEESVVPLEGDICNVQVEEIVEDQVSLAKRTLTTKLYRLEQQIEVFKRDFPNEYSYYLNEIENMRKSYDSTLEEIRQKMTFEIDPELNSKMNSDIVRLERKIKRFIESEVKFSLISKKLQNLIVKLNILYNVSIWHPDEKNKVTSQVLRAITSETEVVKEFKECDFIFADNQLKERIVTLISYADYQIFKIILRNSTIAPMQAVEKLVLFAQFKDFDYTSAFKAFVEDELSDLGELVVFISQDEYRRFFENKIANLLNETAYATDMKEHLLDVSFWSRTFELESSLLEFLKGCNGVEEDKIEVKLIARMNIDVRKSETITSPKTNAYLALTSVFSTTRDDRALLLTKVFKNLSEEVTYKEIYFLLQLFDGIDVIEKTSNTLSRHMKKYMEKYPYDRETIMKKKMYVLNSSSVKQYVKVFALDEDADRIIFTLRSLKIDFENRSGDIYINSFYFNGLENIFSNNKTT